MSKKTRLTVSILTLMFGNAFGIGLISVALNDIVNEFNLTGASQGLVGTTSSVGAMIAIVASLFLQGRIKRTTLISIGAVIMAVFVPLCGLSPTYPMLLLCYCAAGLSMGISETNLSAAMIELQGENSSKFMGALHGCFGVGSLITPLLAQWLIKTTSWRGAFLAIGGLLMLVAAQMVFSAVSYSRHTDAKAVPPANKLNIALAREYFFDKTNVLLLIAMFLVVGGQNGLVYYGIRYISTELGCPDISAAAMSIFWIACTASRFLYPFIKLKPMKVFIISSALSAITLFAGILLKSGVAMLVCCAFAGLFSAPGIPLLYNEGGSRFRRIPMLPVCALGTMVYLAKNVTPPVMGAMSETLSLQGAMLLSPALYGISMVVGIALLLCCDKGKKAV